MLEILRKTLLSKNSNRWHEKLNTHSWGANYQVWHWTKEFLWVGCTNKERIREWRGDAKLKNLRRDIKGENVRTQNSQNRKKG